MIDVGILLQRADLEAVLAKLGIEHERRKNSRGWELYFPCYRHDLHKEDPHKLRMSMADVGRYKGFFYCWACGEKGNLVHLLRRTQGWSFKQATDWLSGQFGSAELVGKEGLQFRLKMNKRPPEPEKPNMDGFALPPDFRSIEADPRAEKARLWLRNERNIGPEMWRHFGIGYSERGDIGECVVIPIWFKGVIASVFYAQPWKGGLKRYPKGSPQGHIIFNYDDCLTHGRILVMESVLDAIKVQGLTGIPSAACFTNMISEHQLRLLRPIDRVGVMPDLDGERGWDLVGRLLPVTGKNLGLVLPPIGKDPGDCTPPEIASAVLMEQPYWQYENQWLRSQAPAGTAPTRVLKNS